MSTKMVIIIVIAIGVPILTVAIAKLAVSRDNKREKEAVTQEINKDAQKTINEAKQWLKEDNLNTGGDSMGKIVNNNSLGELLALEPTEDNYKDYVEAVGDRVKELYLEYQFSMYEPDKSDLLSGYLLQFQILGQEPIYNELFKQAMDEGLDMHEIDDYFYEALTSGDIIPIGEGIIIERDGTGISPIKSGDDVRIIISFVTEEYQERREEAEAAKDE